MADIVPGVPHETQLSPNHGGTRPESRLVILHATRGPTKPQAGEALVATLEREYHNSIAYMCKTLAQGNTSQVSPHFVVGPYMVCRLVHDDAESWATGNRAVAAYDLNQESLSIEVAQPAYLPPFVDFQYEACADLTVQWCMKYGIPLEHIAPFTDATAHGITEHEETRDGRYDGKSDLGDKWDWARFMTACQRRWAELHPPNDWEGISADLRAYMEANALVPRPEHVLRFRDGINNEYVWFKPRAGAPTGGIAMWRKSLDKCYHWGF